MSDSAEAADSLSRAIAEFRAEILQWIDTALVRLREREHEEVPVSTGKPAPAASSTSAAGRGLQVGARTSRPGAKLDVADVQPAMRCEVARNTESIPDRASRCDLSRPPSATPEPQTVQQSNGQPLNSLERLDALARLLDHRLKLVQGVAPSGLAPRGEDGESNA
jgi:hypothetical protein